MIHSTLGPSFAARVAAAGATCGGVLVAIGAVPLPLDAPTAAGAVVGLTLGPGALLLLATAAEKLDEACPPDGARDDRMTCLKASKTLGLGGLAVVDEVTDVLACITFYKAGQWGFFHGSLGLLIFSSLVGGLFGGAAAGFRQRNGCVGFVLGLVGLSPIVEALQDVRDGKETDNSGMVKVFEAMAESAPQFMLQLFYLTVTGWRAAWTSSRVVVLSAFVSFATLALQFATVFNSPVGEGFKMRSEMRGRKAVTVALLFYFAADLGLRALALSVFGYAAEGYLWPALALYVGGHAYLACKLGENEVATVMNAIGSPLVGLLGLSKDSSARYCKAECLFTTAFCTIFTLAGLFLPGLPHPHVDPTFRASATALVAAGASCKLCAFAWYVWPATWGEKKPTEEGYLRDLLSA